MGSVYEGMDLTLGRPVALKIMNAGDNAQVVERFYREALAAAQLAHPHIVQVTDFIRAEGGNPPAIVMERLEGNTLSAELAKNGGMSKERALGIVAQCASALATAHAAGIVHRDIKPDNIFLVRTGAGGDFAKIIDFGIAKIMGGSHTTTGAVFGSVAYMSPEQALGSKELGPASDVWSLGAVLYEILAGRLPVEGNTAGEIVSALMRGHILPLASVLRGAPQSLCWFTDRALAPKPQDRFRDAGEMLTALEQTRRALLGGDLGSAPTLAGASSRPSFPGPEAFAPTAFAPGFSAPPPRPIPSHAPTGSAIAQPAPRAGVSPLVWVGMLGILLVSLLALAGGGLAWAASRGLLGSRHAEAPSPQTGATSRVSQPSSAAPPAPSAPLPAKALGSNGVAGGSASDGDLKTPWPPSRGAGTGKGPAPIAPAASASAPALVIPYPSGWRVAAYRSNEQKPADLATFMKREPQVAACLQAGALSQCAGVIDTNLTYEIQLSLDAAGTVKGVYVRPQSCMVNSQRVRIDQTGLSACVSRVLLGYNFGSPSHGSTGEFLHFESPVRWR